VLSLHAPALAIICLLLFLEEAGLPLPVAPGEAVLLGAGLLISAGTEPGWLVIPLAYLAVLAGIATAYWWAHRIGPRRVRALAHRLHMGGPYDRATRRLRAANSMQIAGSRLLPGLRVYTSLVAGTVGLNPRRFATGVVPASALWVTAFIGLGYFVGARVERLLGYVAGYGLEAGLILVIAVAWILAARWLPAPRDDENVRASPAPWRLPLALMVDFLLVFVVVAILSVLSVVATNNLNDLVAAMVTFSLLGLVYISVARQTVGFTVGEAAFDVRYHPPWTNGQMARAKRMRLGP
jgi:membrane-associated protein